MTSSSSFGGASLRFRRAGTVLARSLLVGGLTAMSVAVGQLTAAAAPGDGSVSVRVIQEVNANGLVDDTLIEPALAGVSVHLTDAAGTVVDAVTGDDGIATFTPADSALTGGQYRIDVDNPQPGTFLPGHAANGQDSAALPINFTDPANAKLSSTTEFVDVRAGAAAYVNTSFWYPAHYCQENAAVCGASQPWDATPPGDTSPDTEKTLLSTTYHLDSADVAVATKADTGVVYGIAYDKQRERIFSAAYAKRGSAYGPAGPGGIYVTELTSPSHPLQGSTSQFAQVPNAGDDNHDLAVNNDFAFFDHVGQESLGDIDITDDNRYLFGVNLNDNTVFVYDLDSDSYLASYPTPNPCADPADWHPMGTGVGMNTAYVGGICSASTEPSTTTEADLDALSAHVYAFDPASGTFGDQLLDQPLTYERGNLTGGSSCTGALAGTSGTRWFPWISEYPSVPNLMNSGGCRNQFAYPTPLLADVVEETNGDLVVSFRDRFADQGGVRAIEPDADGNMGARDSTVSGGDLVRGCRLADGSYVLDPNYAGQPLATGSVCTDNNVDGANNGGQPTTFAEYYVGDWTLQSPQHAEGMFGGIALSRTEPTLLSSAFDPTGTVFTQGIGAVGRDGTVNTDLARGLITSGDTVGKFGKGAGMADLEVLCDQAPIQIGNRVWDDSIGNGLQDAGEASFAGVTVNLYAADGTTLVGTTVTDANGNYYFDDTNVDGGLDQNTDYVVALDNADDYAAGGPLEGRLPTQANAGDNDEHDSDGVVPDGGTYPQAAVTTGGAGQDDHSYDFGFVMPVSIGDFVWLDLDGDGVQGADEKPVPGVTVTLLDADGNVLATTTTDTDGYYAFTDLLPDTDYVVQFPTTVTVDDVRYALTTPVQGGDTAADSNPDQATGEAPVRTPNSGNNSGEPGQADDPTIDAGYTPLPVSIGDYVWLDLDGDGVQGADEKPVPGATVTLLDADGNVLATTTTDVNGYYAFTDLLPDTEYGVQFPTSVTVDGRTYPLTTPGQGAADKDSNADPTTGIAWVTTPKSGNNSGEPGQADDPTIDAGYVPPTDPEPTEPTEPTTTEPTTTEPTTTEPTDSEPTTTEPTSPDPTEPTTTEPTDSEPSTAAPTTAEPTGSVPTTAGPTSGSPGVPPAAGPPPANPPLASTGVNVPGILAMAFLLLGAGAALTVLSRRRRQHAL